MFVNSSLLAPKVLDKFRNKYRIPSARAPWRDYSANGRYFITLCSAHREHLFGEIRNKQFNPSSIGRIVLQEWDTSFVLRPNLFCDAFVLMPDHLHAIVRIDNTVDNGRMLDNPEMGNARVTDTPADEYGNQRGNEFQNEMGDENVNEPKPVVNPRRPKSISSFIAGFKSAATKRINEFRNSPGTPVWQTRFHDRIIRDEQEFHSKRRYILNNPAKWKG